MPYFIRAAQSARRYVFEVCDSPRGECPGESLAHLHRRYEWHRPSIMSLAEVLREIRHLEAWHASQAAGDTLEPMTSLEGKAL